MAVGMQRNPVVSSPITSSLHKPSRSEHDSKQYVAPQNVVPSSFNLEARYIDLKETGFMPYKRCGTMPTRRDSDIGSELFTRRSMSWFQGREAGGLSPTSESSRLWSLVQFLSHYKSKFSDQFYHEAWTPKQSIASELVDDNYSDSTVDDFTGRLSLSPALSSANAFMDDRTGPLHSDRDELPLQDRRELYDKWQVFSHKLDRLQLTLPEVNDIRMGIIEEMTKVQSEVLNLHRDMDGLLSPLYNLEKSLKTQDLDLDLTISSLSDSLIDLTQKNEIKHNEGLTLEEELLKCEEVGSRLSTDLKCQIELKHEIADRLSFFREQDREMNTALHDNISLFEVSASLKDHVLARSIQEGSVQTSEISSLYDTLTREICRNIKLITGIRILSVQREKVSSEYIDEIRRLRSKRGDIKDQFEEERKKKFELQQFLSKLKADNQNNLMTHITNLQEAYQTLISFEQTLEQTEDQQYDLESEFKLERLKLHQLSTRYREEYQKYDDVRHYTHDAKNAETISKNFFWNEKRRADEYTSQEVFEFRIALYALRRDEIFALPFSAKDDDNIDQSLKSKKDNHKLERQLLEAIEDIRFDAQVLQNRGEKLATHGQLVFQENDRQATTATRLKAQLLKMNALKQQKQSQGFSLVPVMMCMFLMGIFMNYVFSIM